MVVGSARGVGQEQIEGLADAALVRNAAVFHAGTRREDATYYTCSGRVLGVTGTGSDVREARQSAYEAVSKIRFSGAQYRRDIAQTAAAMTGV